MSDPTRYQRPTQSSYAKRGWWARHLAEIGGGAAGFILGFILNVVLTSLGAGDWTGAIPWIGLLAGAVTLRWVARPRQAPSPPAPPQRPRQQRPRQQ